MNYFYKRAVFLLLLAVLCIPLQARRKINILTVNRVLRKAEAALKKMSSMKAAFTLENGKYRTNGTLFYKKPFYLRVNSSDGSQMVSNGKTLWIYVPKYGIVAEQEIVKSERHFKLLLTTSRKSFRLLKRDYSFRFSVGGKNNKNYYILDLYPRITKIGFKWMRMWIDKSSYVIKKVNSKTINNRNVNITFSSVKLNDKMSSSIFWFGMPDSNVQVIKNTILPIDIYKKRR